MTLTIITSLLLIILMVGMNALYVAGEFATVSARKTRIMQMADDGSRLAKMVLPILEDHHRLDNYIAASQVGITISSVVLGIYGQNQIAPLLEPLLDKLSLSLASAGLSAFLVLIVLTTLQVVFGELLPKSVALQYPEQVALGTAIPMKWSADIFLKPLIILLNGSGRLVLKLLGVEQSAEHTHVHSPEEIVILVQESQEAGALDAEDEQLLKNVFRSTDTLAAGIVVPRMKMVSVDIETSIEDVLKLAAESAYTRIPVYEGDIDHMIGFVHLKEVFKLHQENRQNSLRSILREIPRLSETLSLAEVWDHLNEAESYIAIVFDEYGGTSGMLTREDVIEELFGEVQDEFDEERAPISRVSDTEYLLRGDTPIEAVNAQLELDLPVESVHTIAGLFMEQMGSIPGQGDIVQIGNISLQVQSITERTINGIRLTLTDKTSHEKDA